MGGGKGLEFGFELTVQELPFTRGLEERSTEKKCHPEVQTRIYALLRYM
jgi:hypothetical protein